MRRKTACQNTDQETEKDSPGTASWLITHGRFNCCAPEANTQNTAVILTLRHSCSLKKPSREKHYYEQALQSLSVN